MKMPLICDDHGDIDVYSTLEEAEHAMEADDIEGCEFFDAEGFAVEAYVIGRLKHDTFLARFLQLSNDGSVHFKRKHPLKLQKDILIQRLSCFLARCGNPTDSNDFENLLHQVSLTLGKNQK